MQPEPKMMSASFRVGKRWTVEMRADPTARPLRLDCHWFPDTPRRRLKQKEAADYQRGRDAFVAELGKAAGYAIGVVDLGAKSSSITVPARQECEGSA